MMSKKRQWELELQCRTTIELIDEIKELKQTIKTLHRGLAEKERLNCKTSEQLYKVNKELFDLKSSLEKPNP